MGKAIEKKKQKIHALMDTGYELFTEKGLYDTSVGDITERAGVAKGTFYLYFKDKYELHDRLVISKSSKLFVDAYNKLSREVHKKHNESLYLPEDALLYVIDQVLDVLEHDPKLLEFLHKDLSLGIFNEIETNSLLAEENPDFITMYRRILDLSNERFRNSRVMLFLIMEMVGSTSYTALRYGNIVTMDELRPYLRDTIHDILERNRYIEEDQLRFNDFQYNPEAEKTDTDR